MCSDGNNSRDELLISSDGCRRSCNCCLRTGRCSRGRRLKDSKRADGCPRSEICRGESPSSNGDNLLINKLNRTQKAVGRHRQYAGRCSGKNCLPADDLTISSDFCDRKSRSGWERRCGRVGRVKTVGNVVPDSSRLCGVNHEN